MKHKQRNSFWVIVKEEAISDIKFIMEHELIFSILLFAFAAIIFLAKPPPPKHLIMLTGAPGMAYSQYGEKYKKYFAEKGFDLKLISTGGSAENVKRLNDPSDPAEVGFVQGGAVRSENGQYISTLGSLFMNLYGYSTEA